jgi:quinol-cytochrome oxidoreductase complex cytochrome b subunit
MEQAPIPHVPRIKSLPDLVRKEVLAALISLLTVCLLSAVLDAPLEGPARTGSVPAEQIKAPWIFLGIQQMLRFYPPFLAGVLVPALALTMIACLPYLAGRQQPRATAVRVLFFGVMSLSVLLTLWGYLS